MLYVRTYVCACARSQGVRKVVKSEGAGTQTIRNLGIKVRAIKSMCHNKEVSYSHILLVLYMALFSSYIPGRENARTDKTREKNIELYSLL